jgi:hypothetical protein
MPLIDLPAWVSAASAVVPMRKLAGGDLHGVRAGKAVSQQHLQQARAVDHGHCHLVTGLAARGECSLRGGERGFRRQQLDAVGGLRLGL